MRKRQLKRLEAKCDKMAIKIDAANEILENIKSLKEAMKVLKNDSNAYVSIAICSKNQIVPITDCFEFDNDSFVEVLSDQICYLQEQFKKL